MKKNKIISISISLILILTLLLGLATTPVMADSVYSLDDGWDEIASGLSSGTSGYIDFGNDSGCTGSSFQTNLGWSRSEYNSFYVYTLGTDIDGSPVGIIGWWNLTQSFSYIPSFSFYVNFSDTSLSTQVNYLYLDFNDSIYDVLKLRFSCSSDHSSYATLQNYDVSTGWTSVEKVYTTDALNPYKITVTHVQTNLMNVSLYNVTDDLVGGIETSASTSNTWDTFESIYFWCSDNNQGNWVKYYFDNFNITSSSAGQDQSSQESDYERCSAGDYNNINLYSSPYIESFITSFGDVTINEVELFVNVDQYNYVNNSKNAYLGYLNEIPLGNPDYFFQDSSSEYILRWEFSGIDIGFYDIVLELGMTGDSGAPYNISWMNLPTNRYNIQGSTYHDNSGDFGDGVRQGIYFYPSNTDYGIKYCLYYDLNTPVASNTYDLTLLSVDPHLQGNKTSISVDVTGDNDWWAVLRNPSNGVFFETHFGGSNGDAVYQHTFSPDAEIGEWTFYTIDRGYWSHPVGGLDNYGTNISLNVSDGSGDFGEWEVFPYIGTVPLNHYTGFDVLAPVGQEFTVRVYSPNEADYNDYVDIGEGSTLVSSGYFIECDEEGWWTLMLFNTTGSVNYNEDIEQFFVTGDTFQNSLSVSLSEVCVGGYVTFEGSYINSVGSIEIVLDAEHSYSYGIPLGTFTRHFTIPMDAIGSWTAYLADAGENMIDGTTVTFTSLDCSETPPDEDDDTKDNASQWADAIIPDDFNPYVGAIIVGIFMCIPFGLSAQTGMEFPMIGYGFFGMLGLGLSTSLGFFPMWIIYSLVVAIIGIAVIIVFVKR